MIQTDFNIRINLLIWIRRLESNNNAKIHIAGRCGKMANNFENYHLVSRTLQFGKRTRRLLSPQLDLSFPYFSEYCYGIDQMTIYCIQHITANFLLFKNDDVIMTSSRHQLKLRKLAVKYILFLDMSGCYNYTALHQSISFTDIQSGISSSGMCLSSQSNGEQVIC